MAPRRKVRALETQLAFEALTIEGALLSPEWLSKIAQLNAAHQGEADYRVPKGLALRDEIGRFWRIAQAHWTDFKSGLEKQADAQALSERFVLGLLRETLGFASLAKAEPVQIGDRSYPIGHRALEGRVPVVIAAAASGLDALSPAFGDDGRRRSAFGLAQELLNADEKAMWGLATDGLTLRLCRDNASLTRPAWIEADLSRVFVEERYADFAALWLLVHDTRFGASGQPVTDCPLEAWRVAGHEEGTRARDKLRDGVEDALIALGRGFLAHSENRSLRAALHGGDLTRDAYFQQLLRLVYRIIFLLTAEERGVLHPPDASEVARTLYEKGYGLRRLRDRAAKRSAHVRFGDLWEGLKITFRGVATGEPRLALPALGGLFTPDQCPALDASKLENRWLLAAVFKLSWLREESGLARVNWRDMGPEELGSVYESLLELVPQIPNDERGFSFARGDETKGNARKTTGSYYTPAGLVQVLLDSALEPVIQATVAAHPEDPAEALLKLAVVDPACGSGHFLLAAARRLAIHVARYQANGTPSAEQYRHAVRRVVSRCLFGVDLNPMAVELCRVSLWMEAVEPGRPLSFLDSHVQRGNALLGATPELMKKGVPDAAFEPIEGDDKKTASLLKKRNKEVSEKQGLFDTLWSKQAGSETDQVARAVAELDAASDADLAAVAGKEARWEQIQVSDAFRHQRFIADAWCAAFVWPKPELESAAGGKQKKASPIVEAAPTSALWLQIQSGKGQPPPLTVKTVDELAAQYHFFHWHLAFPQVFARGGFDVVLGNPPWERVKLQELEFFASRHPAIANAANAAARKKLIAQLPKEDPILWGQWVTASRQAEGQSHFMRQSDRFPLCGKGDVNTYAVFAENNRSIRGSGGRAGFIVPSGIATDDTTKDYFASLVQEGDLRSLIDFQSGPGLFAEIGHARFKFCLLTLGQGGAPADLVFFVRDLSELNNPERHFELSSSDFALLNPNTRTCPTFRSRRDAAANLTVYRRAGVLWRGDEEGANPWNIRFLRMFDMAQDSARFRTKRELDTDGLRLVRNRFEGADSTYLPLYEAKMVHHFDHRYGDYADKPSDSESTSLPDVPIQRLRDPFFSPIPRYWVQSGAVAERLSGRWDREWLLGWRDICRSFDERTVIASLIPCSAVGDKFLLMLPGSDARDVAALYANMCSFALDYCSRQKLGGTSLKYFTMKQLPVLPPQAYAADTPWLTGTILRDWLLSRILELTFTAWDLSAFAQDVGYSGAPFRWDPDRRLILRTEIDAAFFHLYGITRDDADYILDTFPIVQKHDQKAHGEYRTKRVILEVYDAVVSHAPPPPARHDLSPP
jgi:hypothetical protein